MNGVMKRVDKCRVIPAHSLIGESFEVIHYFDVYRISVNNNVHHRSIDSAFSLFARTTPRWLNFLMKIRNFLVQFIGIKPGETNNSFDKHKTIEPGTKFGFFKF